MQIGTVKIESKLALAPMAGVTDAAFRQICSEKGAGYTVTELVSAKALCYHDTKTAQLLRPFPGEKPFAAQIFGSDVNCMAEAAQMAIEISGADMAMIGRGSFGNPWLFEQSAAALSGRDIPPLPPFAERWDTAVRQVELSAQYQNERVAMLQARHHLCWYLKGISHANYYKEKIVQLSTLSELHALSASIKRDLR